MFEQNTTRNLTKELLLYPKDGALKYLKRSLHNTFTQNPNFSPHQVALYPENNPYLPRDVTTKYVPLPIMVKDTMTELVANSQYLVARCKHMLDKFHDFAAEIVNTCE